MNRTRERFPRVVHSVDELSGQVAEIVRQHQPIDAIRYMVSIPPGTYPVRREVWGFGLPLGWRETPERTLVFGQHSLAVIEVEQALALAVTTIPMAALLDVHLFLVLLYSWVEVLWEDQDEVKAIKLEYNSVGDHLIWRGVTEIRDTFSRHAFSDSGTLPGVDLTDFPFKFKSYLRDSLLPEEHLVAAIYQPAIRPQVRRWQRFVSPNRAVVVSDRNIVVIEDQRNRFRRGDKADADYTMSRHFYPLDRLREAYLEAGQDADRLRLRFGTRDAIYDVVIPMERPQAQWLCDLLRDCMLTGGASL